MVRTVKKPEIRRQEIIQAAHKIFSTKGYEKTTMKDVMDELEIAKGTIYHYFKSKEDLFEAVVDQTVDYYIANLKDLPIFMAVGRRDETVPLKIARQCATALISGGARLDYREYNTGHKLNSRGMRDLAAWWRIVTEAA